MTSRMHGTELRIDIVAVGMLFLLLGLLVCLFGLAELRLPVAAPKGDHLLRDQALFVLSACLLGIGGGLIYERPWAWLPAILFCGLLANVSLWAVLALGYVPWMLLQADTREIFLQAPGRRLMDSPRDAGVSMLLSIVLALAVGIATLAG